MEQRAGVVIVGGGHAGAQAAIALRHHGFAGSILLIGREPELPYERSPLSKEYLSGHGGSTRWGLRSGGSVHVGYLVFMACAPI